MSDFDDVCDLSVKVLKQLSGERVSHFCLKMIETITEIKALTEAQPVEAPMS